MALPPELAARILSMREQIAEQASSDEGEGSTEVIQLAVRMPASLRDGIHALARQRSCSTQELVNQILRAAVVEAQDPQLRLASRLFSELRKQLGDVVDSGAHERFTAELGDPDLAEG